MREQIVELHMKVWVLDKELTMFTYLGLSDAERIAAANPNVTIVKEWQKQCESVDVQVALEHCINMLMAIYGAEKVREALGDDAMQFVKADLNAIFATMHEAQLVLNKMKGKTDEHRQS